MQAKRLGNFVTFESAEMLPCETFRRDNEAAIADAATDDDEDGISAPGRALLE